MKLSELARQTNARLDTNIEIVDIEINGAAGLDVAEPAHVTFLANPRYTAQVKATRAAAIFVGEDVPLDPDTKAIPLRTADPYLAYTRALRLFHPEPDFVPFIHPTASIDDTARIDPQVSIGAYAVINRNVTIAARVTIHPHACIYEDASIGADSVIHSHTSIRERTLIGERVTIHNNTTVGSDGFGYAKDEKRAWLKIPQTGRVRIEDDVEIGANTSIDRASVGETVIKRGAKIDNLVQIGHSCTVGEDSLICAQTGLAGTSHIGDRVILAGQVGIAGHLKVGDDAVITAKSATSHDVAPGKMLSGIPAFDNRDWLRSVAAFRRLGEMARANRDLEKRIAALEGKIQRDIDI